MSRDLGINRAGNNRYYYYNFDAVKNNKLVQNAQALGRFDADDVVAFGWKPITSNGNITSQNEYIGTIYTYDEIGDLRPPMFVVDEGNNLFIVSEISEQDNVTSEELSSRAIQKTTIVLRGLK